MVLPEYVVATSLSAGLGSRRYDEGGAVIATEVVRVVGVAVVERTGTTGRVLAARRTSPPEAAGGWELPGGKCEPGEEPAAAAVREIREELGCEVQVTGRLEGVVAIRPGLTLEVVTAVLVAGEPVPVEHDAIRWLGPEELDEVRWLPADVPFLAELAGLLGPSP